MRSVLLDEVVLQRDDGEEEIPVDDALARGGRPPTPSVDSGQRSIILQVLRELFTVSQGGHRWIAWSDGKVGWRRQRVQVGAGLFEVGMRRTRKLSGLGHGLEQ